MGTWTKYRVQEIKKKYKHTLLLTVAIELCDCVHRWDELKLGAVPLLNPDSVISLSAEAEQQDGLHF